MSEIVYRISWVLGQVLNRVPIGTNLGLFWLMWALLSGRFLLSRGAVFPALCDLGLPAEAVRRSVAALEYGTWNLVSLLSAWQQVVGGEKRWQAHRYEGMCPVACDLVGFFRPHLLGCANKHYTSQADKALPAVVLALVACVGSVRKTRLALPRRLMRAKPGETDADLQRRIVKETAPTLQEDEALIVDAGFSLADLLAVRGLRFVARAPRNLSARRNARPDYGGKGRPSEYGEKVRPLARKYNGKTLPATKPDATVRWKVGRIELRAFVFDNLVLSTAKPGSPSFRCVVIVDPRYKEPLVLVTNLSVSAYALWCLYRDRWPIEQLPLAAKQMLGCERSFVFGAESRYRLPELALLAGNLLSYVAACSAPIATGFWDRAARPTCGRLRRRLLRLHFIDLPLPEGRLRKKASVTRHLPKGICAHRRQKAASVTGS